MIKATATDENGRQILILGLSHANLDKLREDGMTGYIPIRGEELGLPIDIMITAGPTEEDMAESLRAFIGPDTIVHRTPKAEGGRQ